MTGLRSSAEHLQIGSLIFDKFDQIDLTGPIEVFSRIPRSTHRVYGTVAGPYTDARGLRVIADAILDDAPQLDLLHIPGGFGQESLMDDPAVLGWIQRQSADAEVTFSVCTGALLLGAAGLMRGRRATTHWSAFHLLPLFGAEPVNDRVVIDGTVVTTAGVTAGIDGALRVAAMLRGDAAARLIQLAVQYAPKPPFDGGTPERAPAEILRVAGWPPPTSPSAGRSLHAGSPVGWGSSADARPSWSRPPGELLVPSGRT